MAISRRHSDLEEIYQVRFKNLITPGLQAVDIAKRI
jgi:hypothetical protein